MREFLDPERLSYRHAPHISITDAQAIDQALYEVHERRRTLRAFDRLHAEDFALLHTLVSCLVARKVAAARRAAALGSDN